MYVYTVRMSKPKSDGDHTAIQRVRRGSLEDREELQRRIIDAAFAIQAREGVAALTVRRLSAELGRSPMALYRYFPHMHDLLGAMWQRVLIEAQSSVRQRMSVARTARARLRASVEGFVDYWESHPEHFVLVFTSPENVEEQTGKWALKQSEAFRTAIQLGTDLMEELAVEIGGDPGRAELARDLRMALLVGYLHSRLLNRRYPWSDLDALRDECLDAVLTAVENCLMGAKAGTRRRATARVQGPRRTV